MDGQVDDARAVILVEGMSDQRALEALAVRRGRDLVREGVAVVAISGSKNIARAVARYGPAGLGLRLTRLRDAVRSATTGGGQPLAVSRGMMCRRRPARSHAF